MIMRAIVALALFTATGCNNNVPYGPMYPGGPTYESVRSQALHDAIAERGRARTTCTTDKGDNGRITTICN